MAAAFACLGLGLRERSERKRRMEADGRRVGCMVLLFIDGLGWLCCSEEASTVAVEEGGDEMWRESEGAGRMDYGDEVGDIRNREVFYDIGNTEALKICLLNPFLEITRGSLIPLSPLCGRTSEVSGESYLDIGTLPEPPQT